MMILHGYWRSSASYRVRIALALKNIDVRHSAVNLKTAEQHSADHARLNAQAFVPVLELEDGTMLTQSLAIIDYLQDRYPTPSLLPLPLEDQAKVRASALIIGADIAPLQNLSVLQYVRGEYGQDNDGVRTWAAHWIEKGFRALETVCAQNEHDYLYMDTPGVFECCLIPQIYNANRFGIDMRAYPALTAINARALARPEFISARPENQADAPKA